MPFFPTKQALRLPFLCAAAAAAAAAACAGPETSRVNAAPAPPASAQTPRATGQPLLTGQSALGDWSTDAPGVRRKITAADLPAPYATPAVDNGPRMAPRPENAWPKAPAGFTVTQYAAGLTNPRIIVTAPNGDLFVAESQANRVKVLRDKDGDGKAETVQVYSSQLSMPFGIAFYPRGSRPQWVYVANTDSVVRFPYRTGDMTTTAAPEVVVADIPGGGRLRGGGHWTRDIAFSRDNKTMFVSVGSLTNVHQETNASEDRRAMILAYTPDGKSERVYASGIRNAVGIAVHPQTGDLWCSVNERDGLGDHLVPDYITRVREGGFYGWPWYYIGGNQDPRHQGAKPELRDRVIVPDVLLQSHSASLGMTFYTGRQVPAEYRNLAFAAEHGSWNRARRTGYKVVYTPARNGVPTGEYVDFLTGFVASDREVWGRPVGVSTARDGSLLVSDDGSGTIWRVAYTGKK
jgi:glucose/arabinose dehydrogenase